MDRETARRILQEVQANSAALDACAGPHAFVDLTPEKKLGKDYRCTKCGGTVESLHYYWYMRGLAHGRIAGATS